MQVAYVVAELSSDRTPEHSSLNTSGDYLHVGNSIIPMKLIYTDCRAHIVEAMIHRGAHDVQDYLG